MNKSNDPVVLPEKTKQQLNESEINYFKKLIKEHSKSFVSSLLEMTDKDIARAIKLFKQFEEEKK